MFGEASIERGGRGRTAGGERGGIVARGKAESGDKTMVDAWTPAVDAAHEAADSGASAAETRSERHADAAAAAPSTEPLVARKGRASLRGRPFGRAPGPRRPVDGVPPRGAAAATSGTSA